jgi:Concanavalin A-like lectin/glucanases superfamily
MHFTISNASLVTWLDGGLRLDTKVTLETTAANLHVGSEILTSGQFTIEAWVTTPDLGQGLDPPDGAPDHATIVNISGGIVSYNALLGQVGDTWVARARTSATDNAAMPEIATTAGVVKKDKITHLALVVNGTTRVLYVDGTPVTSTPIATGAINWDPTYAIRIGDATDPVTYDRRWRGIIYFLAVWDRALMPTEVTQNRDARYDCSEC